MKENTMHKKEFEKADEIVGEALAQITVALGDLLDAQENKFKIFVLEGALHAVIHTLENHVPSGLYSTQFIIGALNESLTAQIRNSEENSNEMQELIDAIDDSEVVH